MSKQVQIDYDFFKKLCAFFCDEDAPTGIEADEIRKELSDKIDKIIARDLYTKYKRSPTGAEREAARKAYLNHQGIPQAFRSDTEYHEPKPPRE